MAKGIDAERELVHLFWKAGWAACRVAGSGAMKYPLPDLIAGNGRRVLAIECKSTKFESLYIDEGQVQGLLDFARLLGAQAWIGLRFPRQPWRFVRLDELTRTEKSYAVSKHYAIKAGLLLEQLLA